MAARSAARKGSGSSARSARSALVVAQRAVGDTPVEVRRSARRRRTVSAYRDGDRVVVLIPARFSRAEEDEWVGRMVARVEGWSNGNRRRPRSDADLARRAAELSERYLDGRARPASVRWVPVMRTRWASCTPADATIRLSRRLQDMPTWVSDYVLLHELAHLLEPGHGPRFWRLVERYPRTERARGYLDGVSAAADLPIADDLAGDVEDDSDAADSGPVAGTDDPDGTDGPDGPDGHDGPDGPDGPDGHDGTDGPAQPARPRRAARPPAPEQDGLFGALG